MNNTGFSSKTTVEAGLMTALCVIIMLMSAFVPGLGFLKLIVLPIPAAVLFIRHGLKPMLASIAATGIIVGIMIGPIQALGMVINFSLLSLVLGYSIVNKKSAGKTIFFLSLAIIIGVVVDGAIFVWFLSPNGLKGAIDSFWKLIDMINAQRDAAISMYKSMGLTEEQLAQFDRVFPRITTELLKQLLPGSAAISVLIVAVLDYFVTRLILKKLKYEMKPLPPFTSLYVNNRMGALLIILVCLGLILIKVGMPQAQYFITFIIVIARIILAFDGAALTVYFLKYRFKTWNTLMAIVVIIIMMQFDIIFFYLGLIDMIMDFRKLDPERLFNKK